MLKQKSDNVYTADVICAEPALNIILEAPTRCGKTTLMNELLKLPRFSKAVTHHFAFPKGETDLEKTYYQMGQFELMMDMMIEMNRVGISVILDRSWIGERVWGPRYRHYDPDPVLRRMEDEKISKMGKTKLVRLGCTYDEVIRRRTETKDDRPFMSNRQWDKLLDDFSHACHYSPIVNQYFFNTKFETPNTIINTILD